MLSFLSDFLVFAQITFFTLPNEKRSEFDIHPIRAANEIASTKQLAFSRRSGKSQYVTDGGRTDGRAAAEKRPSGGNEK